MINLLPEYLYNSIINIDNDSLNEIRLRCGNPIVVGVNGKNFYLGPYGITNKIQSALMCDSTLIDYIISKVSKDSFYTINDQLINGYITYSYGIRIGVGGELVYENGGIRTIKNITSLNIRIPHFVRNCSLNCYNYLVNENEPLSVLVVSKPGAGKTTFIRDLILQISTRSLLSNILVVDERGEITGNNTISLGSNVDVILNCEKHYGFERGIRSLNPTVIVTDEINFDSDFRVLEYALTSGVKVIATIHANNIEELKSKREFKDLLNKRMFDRYVVLNSTCGPGTIEGVYNGNLSCIYC